MQQGGFTSDIINLNVGGTRFSTSRQTLTSSSSTVAAAAGASGSGGNNGNGGGGGGGSGAGDDSFFSSLLSGRIPSCRDEHGFIFIDRDPKYFSVILNFLRTKELNLAGVDDIGVLRSEAEFYAITPLVKRLLLCEDLERSQCGDVLFTGYVPAPPSLVARAVAAVTAATASSSAASYRYGQDSGLATNTTNSGNICHNASSSSLTSASSSGSSGQTLKPGNVLRLFPNPPQSQSIAPKVAATLDYCPTSASATTAPLATSIAGSCHSRASSIDFQSNSSTQQQQRLISHSRKSSNEFFASPASSSSTAAAAAVKCHSRNQSLELKQIKSDLGMLLTEFSNNPNIGACSGGGHSSSSSNCTAITGNTPTATNGGGGSVNGYLQVNLIVGHHNWIAVAYSHYVCCYKLKDGLGWQLMFQSTYIEEEIERLAFNSKHQLSSSSNLLNPNNMVSLAQTQSSGSAAAMATTPTTSQPVGTSMLTTTPSTASLQQQQSQQQRSSSSSSTQQENNTLQAAVMQSPPSLLNTSSNQSFSSSSSTSPTQQQQQQGDPNSKLCALVAISFKSFIRLWLVTDETSAHLIGQFSLGVNTNSSSIDHLFFIGAQLVATSQMGKIGVWNSLTQLWQTQDITPISSFDTAGSVLLLGGQNGHLYYIDMQKFPLRMKDNDLLVTQLYKDPCGDPITALSVYLTPKTSNTGNWIEIAYGTSTGQVRVIVQHPETVGHGPQLFQSFSVHRGSVIKVMLTEKHLVSVCAEFNHVRTWSVTRFRGMISTQPGSTPLASFKIVTIDAVDAPISYSAGNDIGPFGDRDNYQVFIQKCVPYTDQLFVRLSSTGRRICTIKSIDYSTITSFCVHECEGPSRLNSRPRRYLFTGHSNGTIQVWDLTTALEHKLLADSSTTTTSAASLTNNANNGGNGSGAAGLGGPTPSEFAKLLDRIELTSGNSGYSTPTTTNCFSPCSYGSNSNAAASGSQLNANVSSKLINSSSAATINEQRQ